ncbi:rhodanese-like domain-containing protein [Pontibacter diazotrophicus]|uniref:Rhodanese-like domain-containing protein n=1 Tax=Pontibacter diazotrophicus TaxID=1400979 RepID=A0A3D8LFV8_9BACT|nr:rhodanese-like domain-containing protein [Pontibacter diazotrophicus]RDV16206.1 rhodanese-like domain-containing protein [Pontibacter diazotrophicus]
MKKLYLASATVWLLILQACGQTTGSAYALMLKGLYSHTIPQLKPEQLYQQLQKAENKPLLLDTRTAAEHKVSHLNGARFIAYENFSLSLLKDVPKDTPIIVYCSVGYRSEKIGEQLQQAGFNNVHNLYGGIFEWINQEYPVYNKAGQTNKVHAYSSTWGIWLEKGEKVYE